MNNEQWTIFSEPAKNVVSIWPRKIWPEYLFVAIQYFLNFWLNFEIKKALSNMGLNNLI